eukprot:scaffold7105_cov116-Isochrysis_galbana.AAC.10
MHDPGPVGPEARGQSQRSAVCQRQRARARARGEPGTRHGLKKTCKTLKCPACPAAQCIRPGRGKTDGRPGLDTEPPYAL